MSGSKDLDCVNCRVCGTPTKVIATRQKEFLGFLSLQRRRNCPSCGVRYNTMEIPEGLAKDFFSEDFWND